MSQNPARSGGGNGRDDRVGDLIARMIDEERAGDARTRTIDAPARDAGTAQGLDGLAAELRAQTVALDGLTTMVRDLKHDLRMVKVDLDKQRATIDRLIDPPRSRGSAA